jgi:methyl-accepting chemotaxis protein
MMKNTITFLSVLTCLCMSGYCVYNNIQLNKKLTELSAKVRNAESDSNSAMEKAEEALDVANDASEVADDANDRVSNMSCSVTY